MIDYPHRAYLSLGSSIKPENNLRRAIRLLLHIGTVSAVSTVWESPAEDRPGDPPFLNAAVLLDTPLDPSALRDTIRDFEEYLGRVRTADRFAPRTIDIDLMLYDRDVFRLGNRSIPDDEILRRPFVAIPLAELDPDYVHPITGESLGTIAARFDPVRAGMRKVEIFLSRGIV